jgi:hypothetical protein
MKGIFLIAIWCVATWAGLALLVPGANAAEWGSLRGNNHSAHASGIPFGSTERLHPQTIPAPPALHIQPRSFPTPTGRQSEQQIQRVPERAVESKRTSERNQVIEPIRSREARDWEANRAREFDRGRVSERVIRERRHLDLDGDRRQAFHWRHFHPGMIVDVLPFGYVPIYVGGVTYFYYQGVFYEPATSGYVVVAPPVGLIVPTLPPGAEAIVAGGSLYYYAAGIFYVPHPKGYQVVPAPLGVTVSFLPLDAVPVTVNGRFYYQARGVYYLPVMQDGVTVYLTAQP